MIRVTRLLVLVGAVASCNGTTGDRLVTFPAFASGAPGASQPFTTATGFRVQLTAAKMRIGAVYFDQAPPGTGFDGPVCIASGVYAAEVPGPIEVNLLSSQPQEFSVYGNGTADKAQSLQIWLTDGDINTVNFAHIVDLAGVATAPDGRQFSFGAVVTINDNRLPVVSDVSRPGQSPICKQRIVQIGGSDVVFFPDGVLQVTIDPRAWFNLDIDFSQLPQVTDDSCLTADAIVPLTPADYALAPDSSPPNGQTCGGAGQPCCATDAGAASAMPACVDSLTCTNGVCGPTFCIPDSNFISGTGANAGVNFFTGIQTAGAGAYSARYSRRR